MQIKYSYIYTDTYMINNIIKQQYYTKQTTHYNKKQVDIIISKNQALQI